MKSIVTQPEVLIFPELEQPYDETEWVNLMTIVEIMQRKFLYMGMATADKAIFELWLKDYTDKGVVTILRVWKDKDRYDFEDVTAEPDDPIWNKHGPWQGRPEKVFLPLAFAVYVLEEVNKFADLLKT